MWDKDFLLLFIFCTFCLRTKKWKVSNMTNSKIEDVFQKTNSFLKRFNVMFEIAKRRQLSESSIVVLLNVAIQIFKFWREFELWTGFDYFNTVNWLTNDIQYCQIVFKYFLSLGYFSSPAREGMGASRIRLMEWSLQVRLSEAKIQMVFEHKPYHWPCTNESISWT